MKIIQINKHAWPHYGGIERVVDNINQSLSGHAQVDVLCVAEQGQQDIEHKQGTTIYRAKAGLKLMSMPISWDLFSLAKKLLPRYDWIILHHPFPLGFLVYLLYGHRVKAAIWYHSDIVRQKFFGWLIRPLLRATLRRVDKVIVSDLSIAKNSSVLRPFLHKVVVIPFALDLAPYTEEARLAGQRLRHEAGKPLVLTVGRLVYYKGHEYLLRAMVGLEAQLIIIGTGALKEKLEILIQDLKLNNVSILESMEDLLPYYYAADVFTLPSVAISEAFGVVQLEAMAAGKPVINTDIPTGARTVSLHGQTGLTVAPANVSALHGAIATLLSNPELKEQYGRAARLRVEEHYSFEQFRQRLLNVLN
jgi:glycosyltransferase involved in cell wall biosynthesis